MTTTTHPREFTNSRRDQLAAPHANPTTTGQKSSTCSVMFIANEIISPPDISRKNLIPLTLSFPDRDLNLRKNHRAILATSSLNEPFHPVSNFTLSTISEGPIRSRPTPPPGFCGLSTGCNSLPDEFNQFSILLLAVRCNLLRAGWASQRRHAPAGDAVSVCLVAEPDGLPQSLQDKRGLSHVASGPESLVSVAHFSID